MHPSRQTAIYRVCARTPDQWDVFEEPDAEPLASFQDKSAALTYAMGLARSRLSWQLLLTAQKLRPNADLRH